MRSHLNHLGVACLTALILFDWASSAPANEAARTLFDFDGSDTVTQWRTVNDGVMGGLSDGKFRITGEGCLEFYGNLSLKNNGGFASVRSAPAGLGLTDEDVIVARVRGDGRRYYLNARVPTIRMAFSYRASFQTKAGEWQEIRIPLKSLRATSFGRQIPDASSVNASNVNGIGFLLADKIPGRFGLEVDWIKVVRSDGG
jgi:monofunctional biosynthetic peptidoglycan transglycosylase